MKLLYKGQFLYWGVSFGVILVYWGGSCVYVLGVIFWSIRGDSCACMSFVYWGDSCLLGTLGWFLCILGWFSCIGVIVY